MKAAIWYPDGDKQEWLGRHIADEWMPDNLAAPDKVDEKFIPTPEQRDFIVAFYRVDETGTSRIYRRGVYSRAKGGGKSPLLAAIAAAEGLACVVPCGFENDELLVETRAESRTPLIQLAAVSEDQTQNAWVPLQEMLREGDIFKKTPNLEILETFIILPRGKIQYVTSRAVSREGARPNFCILDQTESWTTENGGVKLADTIRRNLGKTGGTSIEAPNAYLPGEGSVAENSAIFWELIKEGKAKEEGLLYDHREGPADTDLSDPESLRAGLLYAYGDSAKENGGWIDLNRIMAEIMDPATDPQDGRRYYLNQVTHAADSYVSQPEWAGCLDKDKKLLPRDVITLGFDGSRGRAKGKPDATALIGTRVSDGYQFEVGVWEAPDGPEQDGWTPPLPAIDAAVDLMFTRYQVAAFYADPAKDWRSKVNDWEAKHIKQLLRTPNNRLICVTRDHPFEFWMTGGRSVFIQRAIEAYEAAIRNGDMTHDGSFALTRHVLNARRRIRRQKLTLGKENEYSPKKIDACIAAILSWQARLDCVAAGIGAKQTRRAVRRVR